MDMLLFPSARSLSSYDNLRFGVLTAALLHPI
jgi:hypothetical protein